MNIAEWITISAESFNTMQFDSGALVKTFDPASPEPPDVEDVLCATSGDITATCKPNLIDLGEDINGLHGGKIDQLQYIDGWECRLAFTALNMTEETLKLSLAAADAENGCVEPRVYLKPTDFTDVWWIGRLVGGGYAAVHLEKAINTDGLSLKTSKSGKGQLTINLEGHNTFETQNKVPMKFYTLQADTPRINLSDYTITLHDDDSPYTLVATTVPSNATVTWTVGDTDVCTVTSTWNGCKITPQGIGRTAVTAHITVSTVEYTATCLVTVVDGE